SSQKTSRPRAPCSKPYATFGTSPRHVQELEDVAGLTHGYGETLFWYGLGIVDESVQPEPARASSPWMRRFAAQARSPGSRANARSPGTTRPPTSAACPFTPIVNVASGSRPKLALVTSGSEGSKPRTSSPGRSLPEDTVIAVGCSRPSRTRASIVS